VILVEIVQYETEIKDHAFLSVFQLVRIRFYKVDGHKNSDCVWNSDRPQRLEIVGFW